MDRRQFLKLSAAALAAPTLAGLAGCGSGGTATKTQKKMKLVVGFDQEFPPYGYVGDDGKYTGFDLDLAKAVCKMEGWEYKPTPIS